jgi:hypothetical protein
VSRQAGPTRGKRSDPAGWRSRSDTTSTRCKMAESAAGSSWMRMRERGTPSEPGQPERRLSDEKQGRTGAGSGLKREWREGQGAEAKGGVGDPRRCGKSAGVAQGACDRSDPDVVPRTRIFVRGGREHRSRAVSALRFQAGPNRNESAGPGPGAVRGLVLRVGTLQGSLRSDEKRFSPGQFLERLWKARRYVVGSL